MDIKESDIFSQSNSQVRHPWEIARAELIERFLGPVLSKANEDDQVLDIGCGDAYILSRLARKWPSLRYMGVDSALDPERIAALKKNSILESVSFCNDLAACEEQVKPASLVLLLDVLEHVPDDHGVLVQAASQLKKDGYLLITVPAYQKLYNNHDRWLGHYRRYTLSGLHAKIGEAGLRPVFGAYVFSMLVILRILSKLLERMHLTDFRPHEGIGRWNYGRAAGWAVAGLLYLNGFVDLWLRKAGLPQAGLSVFVLCQK